MFGSDDSSIKIEHGESRLYAGEAKENEPPPFYDFSERL